MHCTTLEHATNFLKFSSVISSIVLLSANEIYDGIQTWTNDNCELRGNILGQNHNLDEAILGPSDLNYIKMVRDRNDRRYF